MRVCVILVLIVLSLASCSRSIDGEGSAEVNRNFSIADFTEISVNGSFSVTLLPADSVYISVNSHKNLIDNLSITNRGRKLTISETHEVDSHDKYDIFIYYIREINSIETFGSVNLQTGGTLTTNRLKLQTKDYSTVSEFQLDAKDLEIESRDKSEVTLRGSSRAVRVKAREMATVNLENLNTLTADLDMSGKSEVNINASNELKGRVLENSVLNYRNEPQRNVELRDQGSINKL
ncbi:MAG: DUF2807 domain-containing protein [Weeksellaceae bacterium]|nr:DUF2807 domain-containing protein [Weeksellaceae bacterium]